MRTASRVLVMVCALLLVVGGATPRARAHSEYARSLPAAGASVPSVPARIEVWFTQELFRRTGANTLEVYASDGRRVDGDDSLIDATDRTHLSVGVVGPLEPGTYRVQWRSLSALDGDSATGTFEFTVDPSAPETPIGDSTPILGGSDVPRALTRGGTWPWWPALALPALLASAVLVARAVRAPFDGVSR